MVKFKDFSRPSSVFQVLLKQILFSRTFQDSPVYSSTFQACANPVCYVSGQPLSPEDNVQDIHGYSE